MKVKLISILIILVFVSCKAQQVEKIALPKIENYTKGELEIKVAPFGLDGNEINIGKVSTDGTIHFNWPTIEVSTDDSEFFMSSIKRSVGMNFCNEKKIEQTNEAAKAVDTKNIFLYKNGQQVGSLFPATQKEMQDNASLNRYTSLVLGNEISWFYSDSDATFIATCTVNLESEGVYNFKETTTYNLQFKKGWNLVQHSLAEKEDWKNGEQQGSLPKTMSKTSITKIPETINWYIKYWGN